MNKTEMRTGMLIRKPVHEVFEAFIDPAVTSRFWFTRGSGRLEAGRQVEWAWEMYGIEVAVEVKALETDRRIVFEWPGENGRNTVEWKFAAQPKGTTFVSVSESGFRGDAGALLKQVADSTQGFSLVLAGAKAFLEHGIRLNLVADRYPNGIEAHA